MKTSMYVHVFISQSGSRLIIIEIKIIMEIWLRDQIEELPIIKKWMCANVYTCVRPVELWLRYRKSKFQIQEYIGDENY